MKIRSGMGFAQVPFWQGALNTGITTISDIARARWGQPAPGTIIETPDGRYVRQADGYPVAPAVTVGATTSGLSPILLIGGLALLAVIATKK